MDHAYALFDKLIDMGSTSFGQVLSLMVNALLIPFSTLMIEAKAIPSNVKHSGPSAEDKVDTICLDIEASQSEKDLQQPTLLNRPALDSAQKFMELHKLLQQPTPQQVQLTSELPFLFPMEIKKTIERFVPESSSWIAPRSNGTKALDFLVKSYSHGFPALPPDVSKHCAEGVRVIVGALADTEASGLKMCRARMLAQTLAEAYTGCQAVQARTVDMLQGEIRGLTSQSLAAQLQVLVEEYRESALDRTVCHFHPGAPTASDGTPHLQLPHLANRYRRNLGPSIGTSAIRMEAALSDRNAAGSLPTPKDIAVEQFWKEFDAHELCRAIVADVNQPSDDVERRVDRRLLLDWAGSHPELGHRIFYDEALQDTYNDMQPSAEQEAMQQPFIHEELACEILVSVLAA
jgi:hypothetical protein